MYRPFGTGENEFRLQGISEIDLGMRRHKGREMWLTSMNVCCTEFANCSDSNPAMCVGSSRR